jgi:hypothetical protein
VAARSHLFAQGPAIPQFSVEEDQGLYRHVGVSWTAGQHDAELGTNHIERVDLADIAVELGYAYGISGRNELRSNPRFQDLLYRMKLPGH